MIGEESNTALIAIFVSRFEAIQVASMLRGYGIHAQLDGEAHAATEYISMALGGHRLRVFRGDYECASEILQQAGVLEDRPAPKRPRRALLAFTGYVAAYHTAAALSMASVSLAWLFLIPLGIYSAPVDPKGRADYYLAEISR